MKKIMVFMLVISFSIYAEDSVRFEFLSAGKKVIETKIIDRKEEAIYYRDSDSFGILKMEFKNKKEKFHYDVQLLLNSPLKSENYHNYLYMGENANLGFTYKNLNLFLGRKKFDSGKFIKSYWKDGMEGLSAEMRLNERFRIDFYALDIYRAFPLFEKNFLLREEEKENYLKKGERYRHGLAILYDSKNLFSKIDFLYLNMENWGTFASDDYKKKAAGDGDFLYTSRLNLTGKTKYFRTGMELHLVRGLDRATYHPERKEKSISISGELVQIFFESNWKFINFKLAEFIPDSDKRNKQGEVLEIGFIGMGTYPSSGNILNKELNYYPSAWVTDKGLQKINTFYGGRMNSFWSFASISFLWKNFRFELSGNYYLPRTWKSESSGKLTIAKESFSRSFLAEAEIAVIYDRDEEDGFYLKFGGSKLYTSKDIPFEGSFAFVQAGMKL